MEEFYRVAAEVYALVQQETDPTQREELQETADEYAELIQILRQA
jgi:hypothetical protein